MLRPDEVIPVIERMLRAGEDRREKIIEAVARLVDSDEHALKIMAADKAVSLALAAIRDDSDERLAFPSRNEEGQRTIVHMKLTKDPRALIRAGKRLEKTGTKMARAGLRLQERGYQLDAFELVGA